MVGYWLHEGVGKQEIGGVDGQTDVGSHAKSTLQTLNNSNMVNFLMQLQNPQINYVKIFEVMKDFRKGGLNPTMFKEFTETIQKLPPLSTRKDIAYNIFDKFNLKDITEDDFSAIIREVMRRGIENNKKCWHPQANNTTCKIDGSGKIIVSAAHSIQNNGVLSQIVENGHVMGYTLDKGDFEGKQLGKNHASIFWGFCNTHDAIFNPIEINPYTGTDEQHFLFAYRCFVVASHKKIDVSDWMNFGSQSDNDILENKRIFDASILASDFSVIETEVFELSAFYPIAVSSSFYLDFDFEGNSIGHSDDRMEYVYVTLLPSGNKTYFFLSYFKQDKTLYGNLGNQLRKRNNLKSDITMLIAAHTENVYFNPNYYKTFIEQHEEVLKLIMFHSQMDYATIDKNNQVNVEFSFTPSDYLNNPYEISFFGY